MTPDVRARWLIVFQGLDPGRISAVLGLEPVRIWRRGESASSRTPDRRYKESGWEGVSACGNPLEVGTFVRSLVDQMLCRAAAIESLRDEDPTLELILLVAIDLYDVDETVDTPNIVFDECVIAGLARLKARIDMPVLLLSPG